MRRALLLSLAVLPLAAFDCGGSEPVTGPGPCTLSIRGAVNEDLWCIVTVFDYSVFTPATPEFAFMLDAYRSVTEVGAGAVYWLPSRPAVGATIGWDSMSGTPWTNVESGDAFRTVVDAYGYPVYTHEAMAPFGDAGTGKLSVTLTSIPPPSTGAEVMNVHGTLSGTLPATPSGGSVTITASF